MVTATPLRREPRTIGRDWAGSLGVRAIAVVLSLVVNGLIGRVMPAAEAGVLFLALSVGQGLAIAALVGSQRVVVRDVSRSLAVGDSAGVRAALASHGRVAALGTAVVVVALLTPIGSNLLRLIWPTSVTSATLLAVAAVVTVRALGLFRAEALRGTHRVVGANALNGVDGNLGFAIILAIVLATAGRLDGIAGSFWFAAAWIPGLIASGMLFARWFRDLPRRPAAGESKVGAGRLAFWGITITGFGLAQGDLWLAGGLLDAVEVAHYGAALRLVLLTTLPLQVVNGLVLPRIGDLHARGRTAELETMLRGTAALALLPSVGITIVFAVAGGPILTLVYGDPTYAQGWTALVVLALGQLAHVAAGSCGALLQMTGNERATLRYGAISVGVLVASGSILAPTLGTTGIALSAAGAVVVNNLLLWRRARHTLGIRTHPSRPAPGLLRDVLGSGSASLPAERSGGDDYRANYPPDLHPMGPAIDGEES